jgi:hypothetical protein
MTPFEIVMVILGVIGAIATIVNLYIAWQRRQKDWIKKNYISVEDFNKFTDSYVSKEEYEDNRRVDQRDIKRNAYDIAKLEQGEYIASQVIDYQDVDLTEKSQQEDVAILNRNMRVAEHEFVIAQSKLKDHETEKAQKQYAKNIATEFKKVWPDAE